MSNNRAFTSDFVSGLREQRDPDAAWKRRMTRLAQRRVGIVNAMSHIKMHIGEWYDDVDGCRTRQVWQIERRRNKPAAVADALNESAGGVVADQTQNEPVATAVEI